jgi:hypothetical protein
MTKCDAIFLIHIQNFIDVLSPKVNKNYHFGTARITVTKICQPEANPDAEKIELKKT